MFRRLHLTKALESWIANPSKSLLLRDRLSTEHLSDLFITLPTRDGSRAPFVPPSEGKPLPFGHHLAFFHPRNPEHVLRKDGTDSDFCPPEPFTRRMWAGGKMKWNHESPLLVGAHATATSSVAKVEKKNFDTASPMIFVKQRIDYSSEGGSVVSVEEERAHVYLPQTTAGQNQRGPREGSCTCSL